MDVVHAGEGWGREGFFPLQKLTRRERCQVQGSKGFSGARSAGTHIPGGDDNVRLSVIMVLACEHEGCTHFPRGTAAEVKGWSPEMVSEHHQTMGSEDSLAGVTPCPRAG